MNVYGKKDESYEESRYPDWTLPEKRKLCFRFLVF